ncbi:hypothetical protein [Pseudoxanthomonas putridarboris]|uniref:Uncharacterized protein n=1 Tax=Pseudoxanthomonas putridarboris TaxID=752605 RepID=A0ABU9J2U3_9GAMM
MHATTWFKTEEGRLEIQQRTRKLTAGLRSILLMVDGQRGEQELQSLVQGLHAPADALAQLSAAGLIEQRLADPGAAASDAGRKADPPPVWEGVGTAERYNALYTVLTDSIRAHLGLKGYFMQLKVERCNDADELSALLPEMATALAKARDHAFATRWLDSVRTALA